MKILLKIAVILGFIYVVIEVNKLNYVVNKIDKATYELDNSSDRTSVETFKNKNAEEDHKLCKTIKRLADTTTSFEFEQTEEYSAESIAVLKKAYKDISESCNHYITEILKDTEKTHILCKTMIGIADVKASFEFKQTGKHSDETQKIYSDIYQSCFENDY
jgi:hypothetical protein